MSAEKFIKAQWRFIAFSAISYAFFYIARKNLSMAQPAMLEEGVISTYAIGIIMTVHGVLYGLSRFINGFCADRLNGRVFMAVGLALSAATNFLFGCSSLTLVFALFWILNGWAQGMGFPPCAKMLAHWIHPKELATKMSVWNASHSVGAVLALGLCSALFALGFGWRWCFWVPAALAVTAAVFTFLCVKEAPRVRQQGDLARCTCWVLGYPIPKTLGRSIKYGEGVVSAHEGMQGDAKEFSVTVPIRPGSSGGPAFDASGKVCGIMSSTLKAQLILKLHGHVAPESNFAVKVKYVRDLLKKHGVSCDESEAHPLPKGRADAVETATKAVVLFNSASSDK